MPSFEYDLRYLKAGASLLENYLLASELYWPPGVKPPAGEPPYPRFTLGALLLARQRARTLAGTPAEEAELVKVEQAINETRTHWRSAWAQKAAEELRGRLILWRNFLEEYRERPEGNYDRYTFEVSRRVQIKLLQPEAFDIPESENNLLIILDKLLQAIFEPGVFIWDADLQTGFPQETYWYLYGTLKKE
jgi:hypothetical protein